jgi:hypothetical protein
MNAIGRVFGILGRLVLFVVAFAILCAAPPLLYFLLMWLAFTGYFLRRDK